MDDAIVPLAAVSLSNSKSAPHLSWRSSGQAKLDAIEKNWELHMPMQPSRRKQLQQRQAGVWRDVTQVRYGDPLHGPGRRRSTAAPNPAAGFTSAVLSCELSVAEALSREQVHCGGLVAMAWVVACARGVAAPYAPCAPYASRCAAAVRRARRAVGHPTAALKSAWRPSRGWARSCRPLSAPC